MICGPRTTCLAGTFRTFVSLCEDQTGAEWRSVLEVRAIAIEAGFPVRFGSGESRGRTSVEIRMESARAGSSALVSFVGVDGLRFGLLKILSISAGLPIALSVIGRALPKDVGR